MRQFKDEVEEAVSILEAYGQYDDALWLMDLESSVNTEKIARIFNPMQFQWNDDEKHYISETDLKIHYIKSNYSILCNKLQNCTLSELSEKELFFIADALFNIWRKESVASTTHTTDLSPIETELTRRFKATSIDSMNAFVLGKIWKQKNDNRCSSAFLYSITLFPYNWSCWLELASTITDPGFFSSISSKISNQNILKYFFQLHTTNNLIQSSVVLDLYQTLISLFPSSFYLKLQLALHYYRQTDQMTALHILQSLDYSKCSSKRTLSHYFILYADILYSQQDATTLFQVLQEYRQAYSDSLVLLLLSGSYWSLLKASERAIAAFQQVVSLDPNCYDGWLLLGDEYLAIEDTRKATSCYQTATRINLHDYRGYYSLATVYNHIENTAMAHYYFMRAISLQSSLPRLWLVLGDFYRSHQKLEKAVDAYEHGVACDETVHSKEGRLCLLNKCSLDQNRMQHEEDCIRWLRAALDNRDCEIWNADGVLCTRMCLEYCKARGNFHLGLVLCEQLALLNEAVITELIEPYLQEFNRVSELNDSVSMDCSEFFVC